MALLESEEAARRLGVKVATLYAYVSRGLIESYPSTSRRRLFDADEVEELARRGRSSQPADSRIATVATSITKLREDDLRYRGHSATDLARTSSFERVADLLWETGPDRWPPAEVGDPPPFRSTDLLPWSVVMAGAGDRDRSDVRPEAVCRAARRITATMVSVLAPHTGPPGGGSVAAPVPGDEANGSIAHRLAQRLSGDPTDAMVRVVDAALILLADHELATSTLAVRIAASTRGDLYQAVLTGLGVVAGSLHGGASGMVQALLFESERTSVHSAVDRALGWERRLPGFGHQVYVDGDPRFAVLMPLVEAVADPERWRLVADLVDEAARRGQPFPNIDLALGALAYVADLVPDAGHLVFVLARVAGWTAHYLEELEQRPLRFRARAVYVSA